MGGLYPPYSEFLRIIGAGPSPPKGSIVTVVVFELHSERKRKEIKAMRTSRNSRVLCGIVAVGMLISTGTAQGGTIKETEDLRDRIVVESGLQVFKPNAVRGAWELYLLGKQIWWASKVLGWTCTEADHIASVLVTERTVPTFTAQDVEEAFGGSGTASSTIVDLFNDLAVAEEKLTANIIAFRRAQQSYRQAVVAGDSASEVARLGEVKTFGAVISGLSKESLSIMDDIVAQHAVDGLGNPVMTLPEAEDFIDDVIANGLPADERQGLLDLGTPECLVALVENHTKDATASDAVGIDLMEVFAFGRATNAMMPFEVGADIASLGIPTVSEWGLAVMTLLVLTAGTIVLMRRRAVAA